MKKTLLALLIVAPLATTLSGCVIAIDGDDRDHMFQNDHDREFENRKEIANMSLYTPYQKVIDTLGVADFTESYQVKEQEIKVLYFRTQRIHKDGLTSKDECTYLHFENGVLTDTGEGKSYKRLIAM